MTRSKICITENTNPNILGAYCHVQGINITSGEHILWARTTINKVGAALLKPFCG